MNEPKINPGRIGITEAARAFGVSTNTIRRRVKKGHLTAFQRPQPGGRPKYVFDIADLVRVFGEPDASRHRSEMHPVTHDTDMTRNVTPKENTVNKAPIDDRRDEFWKLQNDYSVLKARFEAQTQHLEDLQRLLTPRLSAPEPMGQRAARYLGDLARAFKGEKT